MKDSRHKTTSNYRLIYSRRHTAILGRNKQSGYALIAIVTFLMIIGALATSGVSLSAKSESLAGNAIQRTRSFQAADGAADIAQTTIDEMMVANVTANDTASTGIYATDKRSAQWWRTSETNGIHTADESALLGVVSPPRYAVELVGNYISDGGTGVVNLDIGAGAYGRMTSGGREYLLFSVESHGNGSFETVETVIETTVVFSY